jgi:hypothetical protein
MRPVLLGLGLMLLVGCMPKGRSPDGGWWRYSLGGSSPFWEELHRFDEDPTSDQRMVVVMTIFADERNAVHHVLENTGYGMTQRGESKTPVRRSQRQVATTRELLNQLAPGGDYPPLERLVIVRWHQGSDWVLARFDRGDLPESVQSIAGIVTGSTIGDIAP